MTEIRLPDSDSLRIISLRTVVLPPPGGDIISVLEKPPALISGNIPSMSPVNSAGMRMLTELKHLKPLTAPFFTTAVPHTPIRIPLKLIYPPHSAGIAVCSDAPVAFSSTRIMSCCSSGVSDMLLSSPSMNAIGILPVLSLISSMGSLKYLPRPGHSLSGSSPSAVLT